MSKALDFLDSPAYRSTQVVSAYSELTRAAIATATARDKMSETTLDALEYPDWAAAVAIARRYADSVAELAATHTAYRRKIVGDLYEKVFAPNDPAPAPAETLNAVEDAVRDTP